LLVSRVRFVIPAALAGLFFAGAAPALGANEVVTGDSLGVGIAMASGFENRAANSISIRAGSAVEQLRKIRAGSTVFMSLGTNDAVGSIKGLEKGIDRIVETANASRLKLIWIGPPCVNKPWDKNAVELDGILRARLANSGVTYVSMRDPSLCTPSVRASDGVHFNMEGYRSMWSKAAAATGYQVASVSPNAAENPKGKKKQRREETAQLPAQPREVPRVRTTVTSASFVPLPLPEMRPSNNKRGSIAGEYFSFGFRWPDTARSSGHYFPAD
jgi:lysophospholipase L1-like esterase